MDMTALEAALSRLEEQLRQHSLLGERLKGLEGTMAKALESLQALHVEVQELVDVEKERQRREAALAGQIGSFVPSDEAVADLERQHQRAEDGFVPSQGPTRYSSASSRRSASGSGPRPSTPGARGSGRP